MKAYGSFHAFLTRTLDGVERSNSRPVAVLEGPNTGTDLIEVLLGPIARVGCFGEEKSPALAGIRNPNRPFCSRSLYC